MAFGMLAGSTGPVALLSTALLTGIALFQVLERQAGRRCNPLLNLALALAFGGGLANLVERTQFGHVTDLLQVCGGPALNFADLAVLLGLAVFQRCAGRVVE